MTFVVEADPSGMTRFPVLVVCALLAASCPAAELPRTDSRTPYVHRITLYDEQGEVISPEDEPTRPYSPRATCGKCHPYDKISRGWHFNAAEPGSDPGRRGEPWIRVDRRTGTQLPLSYRGWPGTLRPGDVGITPWQFVQRFGRHFPGWGAGASHADKPADPKARWPITGRLEIDCMVCHSASPGYDAGERARQIGRQNLRWAATAAAGIAVVRGDARKVPDDYDPLMPPDPDRPDRPSVIYDKARFDADERVMFAIGPTPTAERCYFCHTTREVGENSPDAWQVDRDVHLAAGLTCADCHRHGLDHKMTRCVAGERSCRGCHLGTSAARRGRLAAPRPRHAGLPAWHLDKLTCTACHSGPMPADEARQVQTSRAHGLGLSSKDRRADSAPRIVAPVFIRQANGKIAAHSMFWPAFWGSVRADAVSPMPPAAAGPYAWPLGHDVRPAARSLGSGGCTDCHSRDSAFFFGRVAADSTAEGARMHEFMERDPILLAAWASFARFRTAVIWTHLVCCFVLAAALIHHALAGVAYLSREERA